MELKSKNKQENSGYGRDKRHEIEQLQNKEITITEARKN